MTTLIVALDGPTPCDNLTLLRIATKIEWYKVGLQGLLRLSDILLSRNISGGKIFLDLKMIDTDYSVSEATKRYTERVSSLSTFGIRSTETAVRAAEGTPLKVWQWVKSTDEPGLFYGQSHTARSLTAHGVICPGKMASVFTGTGIDIVCPGVRLQRDVMNAVHEHSFPAESCATSGITHTVVGRPIWNASNMVEAAREYNRILKNHT